MMDKFILIAAAVAASTSLVLAEDTPSKNATTDLQSKEVKDHPGTKGGTTDMPVAKPDSGSLSDKEMKDHPGTAAGTTAEPTAKPESGSLSEKAMEDHPGVTKQ